LSQNGQPAFQNLRLEVLLHNHLEFALSTLGRYDEAIQHGKDSIRISDSFLAVDPTNNRALIDASNSSYHYASALHYRAEALHAKRDVTDAIAAYQRASTLCNVVLKTQPDNPIWNSEIVEIQFQLSVLLRKSGQAIASRKPRHKPMI